MLSPYLPNHTLPNSSLVSITALQAMTSLSSMHSPTLIDSSIPKNRLVQNENSEIFLIAKTPMEVVGERIVRPVLDTCMHNLNRVWSVVSSSVSYVDRIFTKAISVPGALADKFVLNREDDVLTAWTHRALDHIKLGKLKNAEATLAQMKEAAKNDRSKGLVNFIECSIKSYHQDCPDGEGEVRNCQANLKKICEEGLKFCKVALSYFDKLKHEEHTRPYYWGTQDCLGKNLACAEQIEESIQVFEKVVKSPTATVAAKTASSVALLELRIRQAVENGKVEGLKKAIQYVENIADSDKQLGSYQMIGIAYFHLKDYEKSVENLKKAVDLQYKSINPHLKYENPLETLDNIIKYFDKGFLHFIYLENALWESGQKELALIQNEHRRGIGLNAVLLKKLGQAVEELNTPLSLDQMKAIAKEQNTVFIVYSLSLSSIHIETNGKAGHPHPIIWVITDTHVTSNLGGNFTQEDYREIDDFLKKIKTYDLSPQNFYSYCKKWYNIFIKPIKSLLPKDKSQTVTILGDDVTIQLPFSAFLNENNGQYLIQEHPLRMTSSIRTLDLQKKLPKIKRQPHDRLLIEAVPIQYELGYKGANLDEIVKILKLSPEEQILDRNSRILHNNIINLTSYLKNRSLIHFSAHGDWNTTGDDFCVNYNPDTTFKGLIERILIEAENEATRFVLCPSEIAKFQLNTELVFLQNCLSGAGDTYAEGPSSLGQFFLAVGARSTISTLWSVGFEVAYNVSREFYTELVNNKDSTKAQALQEALKIIIKEGYEPWRWGLFVLGGLDSVGKNFVDAYSENTSEASEPQPHEDL